MKKIIFFLVSILFILFFLGWYDVKTGRNSILGNYIPVYIKNFFKNTILIIPNLQNQIVNHKIEITQLSNESTKTLETWKNIISSDLKMITATKITEETIELTDSKAVAEALGLNKEKEKNEEPEEIEEEIDLEAFETGKKKKK